MTVRTAMEVHVGKRKQCQEEEDARKWLLRKMGADTFLHHDEEHL